MWFLWNSWYYCQNNNCLLQQSWCLRTKWKAIISISLNIISSLLVCRLTGIYNNICQRIKFHNELLCITHYFEMNKQTFINSTGCGIWLYTLIIAYFFTSFYIHRETEGRRLLQCTTVLNQIILLPNHMNDNVSLNNGFDSCLYNHIGDITHAYSHVERRIQTQKYTATSPSIAMYVVLTYCATETSQLRPIRTDSNVWILESLMVAGCGWKLPLPG